MGVVPDIIVPDVYQYLKIGEKEMDYALSWDQIKPASYVSWSAKTTNLKAVQAKSKVRLEKSEVFKQINSNAEYMKAKQEDTEQSLNLKTFQAELLANKKEGDSFTKEESEIKELNFEPLKVDATLHSDTIKLARYNAFVKALKKDVYLFEAVQVIKDIRK